MASPLLCVLRASMVEEQCRSGEQGEREGQRSEGEPGKSTLVIEHNLDWTTQIIMWITLNEK